MISFGPKSPFPVHISMPVHGEPDTLKTSRVGRINQAWSVVAFTTLETALLTFGTFEGALMGQGIEVMGGKKKLWKGTDHL